MKWLPFQHCYFSIGIIRWLQYILAFQDPQHPDIMHSNKSLMNLSKQSLLQMNKCVLITGATSGIGRATAREFAMHGYDLVLTGRRKDRLKELREEFSKFENIDIVLLDFDVREYKKCEKAVFSLTKPVDILINNAGLARGLDFVHEANIEHWEEMIDTNIKGLMYMTRLISPQMVQRKSGHIINLGSSSGKEVYPKGSAYCATKFAVEGFTKAIRTELHIHNVRVSQISPG